MGLERAESELQDLVIASGEAASLGAREGNEVVVLTRAESHQPLRFDRPSGSRVGLHVSAMGKALLAFGPDDSPRPSAPSARSIEARRRRSLRYAGWSPTWARHASAAGR